MQDLHITGVEDGKLALVADDGSEFRLAIDEHLHARIREAAHSAATARLSPKEIQAHIRGGMTAQEVAALTGAPLEFVERFEGPVMAEREYVIESALAVPVHTASADPLAPPTHFGDAILERLRIIGAIGEHWSSWKDATGWIVKLSFLMGSVEHDARWQFEPKRQALSPINAEAVGLSRQEAVPEPEVPRLRAVAPIVPEPVEPRIEEDARFDSDAFRIDPADLSDSGPILAPVGRGQSQRDAGHNQTADLLEALRRRRGEREAAMPEPDDEVPVHPLTSSFRIVDVEVSTVEEADAPAPAETQQTARVTSHSSGSKKRGRPNLPSWDEIVFGAKSDDDLA